MEHHQYASLFPMMSQAEIQDLADDIQANGLKQPIVTDVNGKILDGRNRHAACVIAEIKPVYEPLVGSDEELLAYVVSSNLKRRHLTTSQRAMVAEKLLPIYEAQAAKRQKATQPKKGQNVSTQVPANLPEPENKGDARDKAGAAMNVSGTAVGMAAKVRAKAVPKIVNAVETGAVSVSAAAAVAELPQPVQEEIIEQGPAAVRQEAAKIREAARPSPDESMPLTHIERLEKLSALLKAEMRELKRVEGWSETKERCAAVVEFMKTYRRLGNEFEKFTTVGAAPKKTLFEADADFPEHLATPEFQELFAEWWAERKRRKLSVTATVKKKQLKLLATGDLEQATAILSQGLESTWKGIKDDVWQWKLWCDRLPAHADEKLLKKIKATPPKSGSYVTKDEETREQQKRRGRFVDDEE